MDDLSDRLRRIESVSNLRPYGVQQEQPEDMIRMLQAYTRKPAEPTFQQPRKKTAFEKHPSVSRPPSESSIWLRKTATVCTPSPCTP